MRAQGALNSGPPRHEAEFIPLDHCPCLLVFADYYHQLTQKEVAGLLRWMTNCTVFVEADVSGLLPGIIYAAPLPHTHLMQRKWTEREKFETNTSQIIQRYTACIRHTFRHLPHVRHAHFPEVAQKKVSHFSELRSRARSV